MKKGLIVVGLGALYLAIGGAGARLEGCQKCEQMPSYPGGCYCAQVAVGYQDCETSQAYSSCEDCQEEGSCPSGGGGGGSFWDRDPSVNLDDGSSCSGGWFCPAECSQCW